MNDQEEKMLDRIHECEGLEQEDTFELIEKTYDSGV